MKAAYGKTVRAVWAADGGQRFTRASSDPTILTAGVIGSFRKNREARVSARIRRAIRILFAGVPLGSSRSQWIHRAGSRHWIEVKLYELA